MKIECLDGSSWRVSLCFIVYITYNVHTHILIHSRSLWKSGFSEYWTLIQVYMLSLERGPLFDQLRTLKVRLMIAILWQFFSIPPRPSEFTPSLTSSLAGESSYACLSLKPHQSTGESLFYLLYGKDTQQHTPSCHIYCMPGLWKSEQSAMHWLVLSWLVVGRQSPWAVRYPCTASKRVTLPWTDVALSDMQRATVTDIFMSQLFPTMLNSQRLCWPKWLIEHADGDGEVAEGWCQKLVTEGRCRGLAPPTLDPTEPVVPEGCGEFRSDFRGEWSAPCMEMFWGPHDPQGLHVVVSLMFVERTTCISHRMQAFTILSLLQHSSLLWSTNSFWKCGYANTPGFTKASFSCSNTSQRPEKRDILTRQGNNSQVA